MQSITITLTASDIASHIASFAALGEVSKSGLENIIEGKRLTVKQEELFENDQLLIAAAKKVGEYKTALSRTLKKELFKKFRDQIEHLYDVSVYSVTNIDRCKIAAKDGKDIIYNIEFSEKINNDVEVILKN